ncbi:GFA family protein [Thalassotalea psychrophila]|uniref:GFA family protein n=1 Tax=Thalassotalea psychrophila TaxID=3065647 RepID=A0ABY9TYG9_9GAMM|nr:GFA family protein [Colwelliaceae bacterium SQ149]
MRKLQGGCHCKKVRFEILVEQTPFITNCNCSICSMTGFIHLIVPGNKFTLLSDEDELSCYQFNSKIAKHFFCKTCGIKPFYVPRSNPDGYSVNAKCLDTNDWQQWPIEDFDGQNWEDNAASLAHLSKS